MKTDSVAGNLKEQVDLIGPVEDCLGFSELYVCLTLGCCGLEEQWRKWNQSHLHNLLHYTCSTCSFQRYTPRFGLVHNSALKWQNVLPANVYVSHLNWELSWVEHKQWARRTFRTFRGSIKCNKKINKWILREAETGFFCLLKILISRLQVKLSEGEHTPTLILLLLPPLLGRFRVWAF